jgi:hypothetical protein
MKTGNSTINGEDAAEKLLNFTCPRGGSHRLEEVVGR